MPNQCTCYVDIYSDDDRITKALIDKMYSMPHDSEFFSSLIALPDGVKIVDVKRGDVDVDCNGESCIYLTLWYAWTPPVSLLTELSKEYKVNVECAYYEPGCDMSGKIWIIDGEVIKSNNYNYLEGLFRFVDRDMFWSEIECELKYKVETKQLNRNSDVLDLYSYVTFEQDQIEIQRMFAKVLSSNN